MRILILSLFILFTANSNAAGTWTQLTNSPPYNYGAQMNLLSDGTVMIHLANGGDSYGNNWVKLTPDIHGSYINGTFSTLPSMQYTRLDMSSQILKDGRLYVAGGEYGTGKSNAEVYDPLTNAWTNTPPAGNVISDACSAILSDGRVLQALVGSGKNTLLYNPASNTYDAGPSTIGSFAEAAWVKLPDNSILQVDHNSMNSERYIPSLNRWIADATAPVNLYDPFGGETGAGFLLPNGKVFFLGSSGPTAIYTPSGDTTRGTWIAGPIIPNAQGTPDAAAAMMVNGKILCAVSPIPTSANHFPTPVSFYEYDYLTNSFAQVGVPGGGLTLSNVASYYGNLLQLPDGNVLWGRQGARTMHVYTPDGTQLAAGKPGIHGITTGTNGSYAITGTLFNGISEGAGYGDDEQMNTNYPVVRLTSGTNAYYARTFNWNSTGVQRGNSPDTAFFTLSAGISPATTYSLVVTANGISSDPVAFTLGGLVSVNPAAHKPIHVQDFTVSTSGSTLNLHFRLEANSLNENPWSLQLTSLDGTIVHHENLTGRGGFDRQIELGSHGKGVYLFILRNGGDRLSKRIVF